MEELWAYREQLLGRHAQQVPDLRQALADIPVGEWRRPASEGGWSAHQMVAHMRDVEVQAYVPRVHRLLAEAQAVLADFDAEGFMAAHYDRAEPLDQMVEDLDRARRAVRAALRTRDSQAWSRTGRHPALGVCTVQAWVERAVAHFEEHLGQLETLRRAAGTADGAGE